MKVSIIIPTLNEEKYIGRLLDSIKRQTHKPHEIIVVDAYSKDSTKQIALSKNVNKIVNHKPHVARQRNAGAKLAEADMLLFLDADVTLHDRFVENILDKFNKRNLSLACPRYIPLNSTYGVSLIHKLLNLIFLLTSHHYPSGAGCCILVSKNVFDLNKGFSEIERYEDIEFIRRVGLREKFRIIDEDVYISDRRWRKEGTYKLFAKYILISSIFAFGKFNLAQKVKYHFDIYDK